MILEGQRVYTDQGIRWISELNIGDKVLTHRARWDKITHIKRHTIEWTDEKALQVRQLGILGELESTLLTKNHWVYARNPEGNLEWVQCDTLERLSWFVTPRIKGSPKTDTKLSSDMVWALGMYCAKGIWVIDTDHMLVTLSKNTDQDKVMKFGQTLGQLGASRVDAKFNKDLECYQIRIFGDTFRDVVMSLFHDGKESVPTKLPRSIYEWSDEKKTMFLLGYLSAYPDDVSDSGTLWHMHSEHLAYDLQFFTASIGIESSWDMYIWDYRGIILNTPPIGLDDTYLYRELYITNLIKKSSPVVGYSIHTERDNSLCLGSIIVSSRDKELE